MFLPSRNPPFPPPHISYCLELMRAVPMKFDKGKVYVLMLSAPILSPRTSICDVS